MTKGDVNGDGRADVYIGGGRGQAGVLLFQTANGFTKFPQIAFEKDAAFEDAGAVLVDVDGDADLDLAVVSAGYALNATDSLLRPRLYINQKGTFVRSKAAEGLNALRINGSVIIAADIDTDGDQDLFIGAHCVPGRYPEAQKSVLLKNDGKGNYTPDGSFTYASLVTGATFSDINNDKKTDLLLVGEWMKPTVLGNHNGKWEEKKEAAQSLRSLMSYVLHKADLDNDDDDDFVVGNMGLNTQYHVTSGDKLKLYFTDFSGNGAVLPLMAVTENGKEYPYASRDELLDQIPALKKKYSNYVSYSTAGLEEMLGTELLTSATQSTADELRTGVLWNERGRLIFKPLPVEAQYAPIYAIEAIDVDKDGKKDLILGGNPDRTRVRLGKIDANKGQVFLNAGAQRFRSVSQSKSGISLVGEVRSIGTAGPYLLFGINRLPVQIYRLP